MTAVTRTSGPARKWTPTAQDLVALHAAHGSVSRAAVAAGVSEALYRSRADELGVSFRDAAVTLREGRTAAREAAVTERAARRAVEAAEVRARSVDAARRALTDGVPTRNRRELVPATGRTLVVLEARVANPGLGVKEVAALVGMSKGAFSATLSNALRGPAQ